VPDLATLRLTWEPRMLSILRIVVGLLYMEHGLAKVLGFPLQPNHAPYALFTLNPGLQGLLELVGGLLLALGLFTRCVAFVLAGNMAVAYFIAHAPKRQVPVCVGRGICPIARSRPSHRRRARARRYVDAQVRCREFGV
jgi:putative oxidoreductase